MANGVDLSTEEQTDLLRRRVRFAEEQVIAPTSRTRTCGW
jgi:hypothetical protein